MKKPILVLLALLALLPFAQAMAQTQPVVAAANPAATAPQTAAQFLATLSTAPAPAQDLTPAPAFLASCTNNSQCPTGQLCCNACGTPPEDGHSCLACLTPIRGRCPLIP